mgnify:CR=1 FL=1
MKYVLMAWRDAVMCFFGRHRYIKIRGIMPYCSCCGKTRWL